MEIGHRIKQAREAAMMSQTELATRIGVSRGLVGQWESHKKKPGRENLQRIADATLVSVAFILGLEEIDASALPVKDRDEIAVLRLYRRLSDVQKKNFTQLLSVSVDIRREIEHQRSPAKPETITS